MLIQYESPRDSGLFVSAGFYKFQRDYKRLNPEMVLYVLYKGYCLVRENMLHWCWTAGALMCPASEGKRRTERKAATKFDAIQWRRCKMSGCRADSRKAGARPLHANKMAIAL